MVQFLKRHAAIALALVASAGCTVHNTETPAVSGPSTLALSLSLNAIPDSISQDGGSQSSIKITAMGPNGKPASAVPMRIDTRVAGVPQDYGTLSARTVVTNNDGVATIVYTAPPSPAGGVYGVCGSLVGTCVDIIATPTGSAFETAVSQSVQIRLVPPGVILPPASTPTAAFTFSPSPAAANVPVQFDASTSQPGSGATQIASYSWSFGDGTSGTGRAVTHTFTNGASHNVTLTVTNDRGLAASTTQAIGVGSAALPSPLFTFSPTTPGINQTVFFNASTSTPGAGHSIASYRWTFGDGATASGVNVTHAYSGAGTYSVQLTVTDEAGQASTSAGTAITIASGAGASALPTAVFTVSPQAPGVGETVFFNASTSAAGAGHTIASYAWTFGDGATGTGVTATHAYSTAGSYAVQLKVTDEAGQSTTSSATSITAGSPPSPVSNFTFSPRAPAVGQQVVFDASSSTTAQGQTIVDVAWNFGDGTAVVHCPGDPSCTSTNRISAHTYAFTGVFVANLVVTDSAGRTGSSNQQVTVTPPGPTAVLLLFKSGGNSIQADGSGSTATGSSSIASYRFIWGDATADTVGTASSASHTFAAPGAHTVTLVVTDNLGRTGATSKDITTP